jgi:hypothetical protein
MRSLRTIVIGALSALAVGLPAMAETAYVANNRPTASNPVNSVAFASTSSTRWRSC